MKGFDNMTIRFFVYDDEIRNEYDDTTGNFIEVNEADFLESNGVIEYERNTIHENGVKQICLTKNPLL